MSITKSRYQKLCTFFQSSSLYLSLQQGILFHLYHVYQKNLVWSITQRYKCLQIAFHLKMTASKGSYGMMDKASASQPWDHGFEPHTGHDHDFSYDTCTDWFQEADTRVINISCLILFHDRAKINMFKLK